MLTVSFTNLKGGSAKSTTAFNVAGVLLEMGYRLLVIDLDPQQTLSASYFGVDVGPTPLSDALIEDASLETTILPTQLSTNLHVIPADHGLKTN